MANNKATITGQTTGSVKEDTAAAAIGLLTVTDVDPGEAHTKIVTDAASKYGTWSVDGDGNWNYRHNNGSAAVQALGAGKTATDSFTVTSLDGTATKTVTVTIHGTNDAASFSGPTSGTVKEDAGIVISGKLTVSDVDTGEAHLQTTATTLTTYGRFSVNSSDTWNYAVDNTNAAVQALGANQTLTDTFIVSSKDGSPQTITVTINGINDAATLTGGTTASVTEDMATSASGSFTIVDKDNGEAHTKIVTDAASKYGKWSVGADGDWTYQLNNGSAAVQALGAGKTATDSFTVTSLDGTATKTVTVTVNGTNDAASFSGPTSGTVKEDAGIVISGKLTVSDVDTGEAHLQTTATTLTTYGRFSVNSSDTWNYAVDNTNAAVQALGANQTLTDTFIVSSKDGSPQTITVTIKGINDAATLTGGTTASVTEDMATSASGSFTIVDKDNGEAHTKIVTNAASKYGTWSVGADGDWTYQLNNGSAAVQALGAGKTATDSFTVTSLDGTATKTVTVTVNGTNDAPTAPVDTNPAVSEIPDSAAAGTGVGITLHATDIDSANLTYLLTNNAGGLFTVNATTGVVSVASGATLAAGTYTITGVASDGVTQSATQDFTITITGTNDAPVAQAGTASGNEDNTITGQLVATDVDGDTLTYSLADKGDPAHGSVVINPDGSYSYTPAADYNGSDSFTYQVDDGHGGTATATVSLTVNPANDAPVAQAGTASGNEDNTITGQLVATDVDGDTLTYSLADKGDPAHGAVVINPDGSYSYTPAADYNGSDSFTYQVDDGHGGTATATVSLSISPQNDAPVAQAGTASGNEDNTITGQLVATDVDGDTLTYSLADKGDPAHGAVVINPDGSYSYTPAADYNGSDSFTYQVDDGHGGTATATVSLTVNPANDAPVAQAGTASGSEDNTITGQLVATDVDGDTLTYSLADKGDPAHGSVVINSDGSYSYTPAADYNGSDSFTYQVDDGHGGSATATVSLTVSPQNDAPVAQAGTASGSEDNTITGQLVATDVDGDTLTYSLADKGDPAHGSVVINSDGSYSYTPAADYNGSDSFTYQVDDGHGGTATATVSLSINAAGNDAPVAQAGTGSGNEDNTITGQLVATDVDGDTLTYSLADKGDPAHGSVVINPDGSYSYTPAADYNGSDSFTYQVDDGHGGTATATVSLTVNPANDAPVAQAGTTSGNEDNTITGQLVATDVDGDTLTYSLADKGDPAHGSVVINPDGSYSYTPAADYNGSDSFTYQVDDGHGGTATATVSLTISPQNDAPVAQAGTGSGSEDNTITGQLVATDVDGDTLTYSLADKGDPAHGSVVINSDGSYSYTPAADYNGSDSFTYQVDDGKGGTATATVSLTINPQNDAPVAQAGTASGSEDNTITGQLVATDVDGDTLTYSLADKGDPAHGSVVINSDGSYSYTPAADYNGSDSFTYQVDDGHGGTATATVSLSINAAGNDAPVAQAGTGSGNEDNTITGQLVATDVDGDTLTYSLADKGDPAHGSVVINSDGSYSYTPAADYNGSDSFTYQVDDGHGGTATATVSLTVNPANDAPVAQAGTTSGNEDNTITGQLVATDVDGDTLTYSLADKGDPAHGSVVINSDGSYSYTPAADYNGSDSFSYQVDDGHGGTATATVSLTINPQNDAPVAQAGTASGNEDSTITGQLVATDVDGDTLTYSLADKGDPAHGSVVINSDGSYSYTPAADYNGSDSFTYQVDDGHGGIATATVSLTVNPANDAPVAQAGTASGNEDNTITGQLVATDVDGDTLTYSLADKGDPAHGTVVINSDGSYSYTPAADYNGSDSFTYQVDDGKGGTATATVSLTISPQNDAPVAQAGTASGSEDNTITGQLVATDVDGDTLTYSLADKGDPAHGSVVINPDGSYSYTPAADYNGSDSFTYQVDDGKGGTATATVSLTINPQNDAPVAQAGTASGSEDNTITGQLVATDVDGDTLTYSLADKGDPAHGSVVINSDGSYSYTPAADYNGSDSFTYQVDDGHGGTATATVSLSINAAGNDAPVAQAGTGSGNEDNTITGQLVATDVDGDTLTYSLADKGDPAHGSVVINPDGSYSYTPAADYNGSDSFTYQVDDGHGGTATATVSLTVNPANDAPVAQAGTTSGNEDNTITGQLVATDVDGDTLTYSLADKGDPAHGSVVINPDGSYSYTPAADYNGSDSFTYQVDDGHGGTATATVSLTVNPANDAPVAQAGTASGNEDSTITGQLVATDVDGDTLTYSLADKGDPAHGSVTINADGSYSYTPAADYNGSDSFTYQVDDGKGGTATATVSLTINPVNDAPVAQAGTATGNEDQVIAGQLVATDIDGDTLTYSLADKGDPAHGTVTVNPDGSYSYTPAADYNGSDSFIYKVDDGKGGTSTATVSLTINPQNDAPVAQAGTATGNEDHTITGQLVATDIDGDTLTYSLADKGDPTHGSVTINPDGSYSYTPAADYNGSDSFTYQVDDGKGGTATATVSLTINPQNDAPVAQAGTASGNEDHAITGQLTATDVDGDTLNYSLADKGDPTHGSVVINPDGSYSYTPAADYNGSDSFTYQVDDGKGGTATATVSLTINPLNDAPVAQAGTASGNEDQAITGQLVATDVDGDTLTYSLADKGAPAHGSVTINPDGSYSYTPAADYNGNDSFTYQVDDGHGGIATATVALTINPDNHAPVLPAAPTITLVSTDAAGNQGDSASYDPVFSPDGTKVAFASYSNNLTPGDTNVAIDIFVKDLVTGEITRIAAGEHPVWSPDGTKIAFVSLTSDLVPGDTNSTYDVFVKDLVTGTLIRASSDPAGNGANNYSYDPVFSPDGTKVAFYSGASNLVPGDVNNTYDVIVKDLVTGQTSNITTTSTGGQGNEESFSLEFSPDGTKIVFASLASNMVPGDTNDKLDIFVKDLATGEITLISSDAAGGLADDHSEHPFWSPDGTKVAFVSDAGNLVPGDTNGSLDVFVRDLATGAITRVSTDSTGNQGNGDSGGAVFSPDGTKMAFWSSASNLVANDTNGSPDIFIKDLVTGEITRVSELNGLQGNSLSLNPAWSPDGKSITFYSYANSLTPGDTNNNYDIFIKTLPPTITFNSIPADPTSNGGQTVASLLGSKVTDVDAGALKGIAVTGVDTTNGTWQYSLDGGGSWQTFGAVSDASATVLAASALVRFQPALHYNGLSDITIRAWDQTDGHLSGDTGVNVSVNGGNTAYSAASTDVNITVTPGSHTTVDLLASTTTEGASANYVFTAALSSASHGTTIIHTDKGDITIADGKTTGTLTISSGNGEDVYLDASNLTAKITSTESSSNLVIEIDTATAKINDTVNTTAVTLDDVAGSGTQGRTITAHVDNAVTGSDLLISLSNGATVTIPVGATSGTSAGFAATLGGTISISSTSGGNYERLDTSDTSTLELVPDNHAPVLPAAPTITLVSTDAAGHQGNGASFDPVFSPDGTKVAFASYSSDLTPGDTNLAEDIFVKDLVTGEITRIAAGEHPVWSPDGTKIAFVSLTSDLVPGDTNSTYDVFVKDLVTGTLIRASSDPAGNGANNYSYDPVFSPDGTKVAFYSGASNLVPGDVNNTYDVIVKDLVTGQTSNITTTSTGGQGNEESFSLEFSPDGTKIVFASLASNMVPGDTNDKLDIFVKDLATGEITLISSDAAGGLADDHSEHPFWSPDGTKVAFVSDAGNLVPGDTNGSLDVFVRDLATGAITRVSTDSTGNQGNGDSGGAVFSPDGTKMAFWSSASNLVANDTNGSPDIFIKDLVTGEITRVSELNGLQGNSLSLNPAWSPDGKSITFYSYANSLTPGDTNNTYDIFVKTLPPTITFSSIPADPTSNGGQTVASLLGSKVTDVDAGALKGIAVTGVDTTNGTWQYSLDGGGFWQTFGAVSDASATVLAASALVRFQPALHFNGLSDITIRAWDQTDGHLSGDTGVNVSVNGGNTAYSAASTDVNITVTPSSNTTVDLLASTTIEGAGANYVFTAALSGASQGTTIIHTDKGDITIADGQSTGTLTIVSGNGEDAYNDASNLTAKITSTEGSNLVVGIDTATAKVNDTIDTTTVNLSASTTTEGPGAGYVFTATLSNASHGITTIHMDKGDIAIADGQTTGTLTISSGNGEDVYTDASSLTAKITSAEGGNFENLVVGTDTATAKVNDTVNTTTVTLDNAAQTGTEGTATITAHVDSAVASSDLVISLSNGATITIPVGATSGTSAEFAATVDATVSISGTSGGNYEALDTSDTSAVGANDAPVAQAGAGSGNEDHTITGQLTASDVDGDTLTYSLADKGDPAHGSVVINSDGSYSYTPAADYNGSDSFTYQVDDGHGGIATATVSLTVNPANDAPVAQAGTASGNEDNTITGQLVATDIDGDTLTYSLADKGDPAHGSVVINPDGSYSYTPAADYNGSDSFIYQVDDGHGGTATATVSLTVNPQNDAPVAQAGTASGNEDNTITGQLVATDVDGDTLTYSLADKGDPAHGSVVINSDGSYSYTPAADYNGSDSFTYQVDDGKGGTATATVSLTINPQNDAPVAQAGTASGSEDNTITGQLVATDVDGDTLTYSLADKGDPAHGSVVINPDGSYSYTPAADYNGSDSFTYQVDDGHGGTATATVSLSINAAGNDAPVAQAGAGSGNEDNTITGQLVATDVDGDTLTYSLADKGDPAHGSVVINPDGSYSYTPAADYNGSDSFTYQVDDGHGGTATATVSLTVNPANDAPVAQAGTTSGNEDNTITGQLVATDVDGDTLTYSLADKGDPAHGSVVINSDGSYSYTPAADYNGSDSFSYQVDDGHGGTATATVSLTINPQNDAPVAQAGTASGNEDSTITGQLVATDVDGDTLTYSLADKGDPAHGSVVINSDGSYSYTPNADYNGSDSFTYQVDDGHGGTATATVSLSISAAGNDAPVAQAGTGSGNEDNTITGQLVATDVDGDTLTYSLADKGDPAHGSVVINPDGSYSYTPAADYNGSDSFTYQVDDGHGGTAIATVSLTVNPVNDAPVAQAGTTSGNEDNTITGQLVATDVDGDTLTYSLADKGDPAHGSVVINPDGSYSYTPAADHNGSDSFSYQVDDGHGGTATATVSLTINPQNDAPVAQAGTASGNEDSTITGQLVATDVDGDTLTYSLADKGDPAHGSVTINADGSYSYTPAADYNGSDSFTYQVDDGHGGTATATVSLTISAAGNDAPVAQAGTTSGNEDNTITGQLIATDVDGDTLTYSLADKGDPAHGSVVINPDGSYSYTPAADYNGSDSFTYQVDDGHGGTATATVSLTVNPANDAPVAQAGTASGNEDNTITGQLIATDVDGDTLTYSLADKGDPAHGSVVINPDGSYSYTPAADYNGSDSFTYQIDDGHGGTATATVSLTVNPANDAPVAQAGTASGNEDNTITGQLVATDVDGDTLTYSLADKGDPAHGSVVINSDGSYSYTPAADYNGSDSFTYQVDDGHGGTSTATVSLTVNPANDAPVAQAGTASGAENQAIAGQLVATDVDGDTLTYSLADKGDPAHGSVVINPDGSYSYTPAADYNGSDSFTYQVDDGHGGTATATVSLTVNPGNETPVAQAGTASGSEDNTIAGQLIATDVDGDTLTYSLADKGDPAHGSVVINSDGSYSYTPAADYNGSDSFTYQVDDGHGGIATATVSLTVNPANDAPVAQAGTASGNEDNTITGQLIATDVDGDTLTYSLADKGDPAHGSVVINPDGSYSYTPAADYNGSDSFSYQVDDGHGGTATATVSLTINPDNDAPVITSNGGGETATKSVAENTTAITTVTATDLDGDSLSYSIVGGADQSLFDITSGGVLTLKSGRDFENPQDSGKDNVYDVTVQASDGHGGTDTQTIAVTVTNAIETPTTTISNIDISADSGSSASDFITNVAAQTITGTLSHTLVAGESLLGSVDGGANWIDITSKATGTAISWNGTTLSGSSSIEFKVTNTDGQSGPVATQAYVLDTSIATPTVSLTNDTGTSASDLITKDASLTVSSAAADVTRTFKVDGGSSSGTYTAPTTDGSHTVVVTDTDKAGNTAGSSITFTLDKTAPVATADAIYVSESTTVTIPASALLGNDTGGGTITAVSVLSGVTGGNIPVTLNPDGSITFTTPSLGSSDTSGNVITYTLTDLAGNTATGTVNVNVLDGYSTGNDTPTTFSASPFQYAYLSTGGGNDTLNLASAQLAGPANLDGGSQGAGGSDTLNLVTTGDGTTLNLTGAVITGFENLTAVNQGFSNGYSQTVDITATQWAGFSTIDLNDGTDVLNVQVVGTVDISAGGVTTISDVEAGNLTGTSGDDSITLKVGQLGAILAGTGKIDLGGGIDTLAAVGTTPGNNDTFAVTVAGGVITAIDGASVSNVEKFTLDLSNNNIGILDYSSTAAAQNVVVDLTTGSATGFTSPTAGVRSVIGGAGNDTLTGNSTGVALSGGSGNDTLTGGSSDDTLDGGTGSDKMAGGFGNDNYFVDNAGDSVTENLGEGTADQVHTTLSTYTLDANVENLFYTGSGTFVGTGNTLDNVVVGNILNDTLSGSDGNDTLTGGDGNDTLNGGNDNDTLNGGNANDTLTGGAGNDTMTGGAGNDTFKADAGIDTITDLGTNDILVVSAGATANATVTSAFTATAATSNAGTASIAANGNTVNLGAATGANGWTVTNSGAAATITGSGNADTLSGGTGNDALSGGGGNDALTGGSGNDTMTGGTGNDTFNVDGGTDTIADLGTGDILVVSAGATANATVTSAFTATAATSNAGTASIAANGNTVDLSSAGGTNGWTVTNGSATAATITGSANDDNLIGGTGNDTLVGGGDNDTLTGGAGADTMTGGTGNDTFVIATSDSSVTIGGSGNTGTITGYDTITDFDSANDILNLQGTAAAAANTSGTNGSDSSLTIGGVTVKSHAISNGIITFDDADTYAGAVSLTSTSNVAAAVQYLRNNDIGSSGTTVAFTATISGVNHTFLYEQLSTSAAGTTGANSLVVDLQNVTLGNLSSVISGGHIAPAGVAGSPINLGLTTPDNAVGPVSLLVKGVPNGWMINQGANNGDGSWSISSGDLAALAIITAADYAGAVALQVIQSWTDANGQTHVSVVTDNVEAYRPENPIFAISSEDHLTASSGDDVFVFAQPIGKDYIYGFDATADKVDLVGYAGFQSFADVQAALTADAAGNAVLHLGTGQSIIFTGVEAATLTADDFVFDQTPVTHNSGSMVLSDGSVLPLSGIVENTGTIALESAGDRTELQLIQHGISFQGGGQVLLSDSDGNVIAGTVSDVTLTNVDNTISGAGNIGEGSLTLINHGSIVATGSHALEIDTGSNAFVNTGTLEATGSGGLHIHGDVENDGLIFANGGGIEIDGDVSGKGGAEIEGTAMLDFGGLFDESLSIGATAIGTVKIDHAADFTGTVAGLDDNDSIVFGDIVADKASIAYTAGADGGIGQLEVTDGEHTAHFTLAGNYEAANFHVAKGGDGTVVTYTHVEPQQEQVPTV